MVETPVQNVSAPQSIDYNNELYIHHGDTSSNCMLAAQKLNGDNYGEWKRAAEIFLSAKNKLGFVNGTCVKPDENSPNLSHWERCNNLVLSWLLHSVEPDIRRSILYYQTAVEVWKELEERYTQSNAPRKFQVHKHIGSLTQGNLSIAAYYTELKSSWDEYMSLLCVPACTCGSGSVFLGILNEQQVMQFLMGLNDDYKHVRGNILMMQPLPTLSQAYRLILQEEKQRECNVPLSLGTDSTALASYHRNQNTKGASSKWTPSPSSSRNNQPSWGISPSGKKSKFYCTHCEIWGHSLDRCFKYPPNKEKRVANHVQTDHAPTTQSFFPTQDSNSSSQISLTQEQVTQLMSLLNQHHSETASPSITGSDATAFMSGALNEASSGPW